MGEILHLLRGTSIDLGQKVIALGERSLLDESTRDVLVAPEQLLEEMIRRFDEARRTLLAVSRAWASLEPQMTRIAAEAARLRAIAAELHPAARGPFVAEKPPELLELAEVEAELSALEVRVAKDPLGADDGVRAIAPRLAALAARLDGLVEARRRVAAALDEARALQQRLEGDHARAIALAERARRELSGESVRRLPAPLDEGLVLGLAEWLRKLEGTVAAHRWSPAEVGLARFREAVLREHGAEAATIAAAEALLGRPGELSGRLSARRAQAAALAARGVGVDGGAEAAAREAEALLRQRPVPIDEVIHAVEAYEAAVVAARR
jgi:hypothetical protein